MPTADRGSPRWLMAQRQLVRRLNLEVPSDQRPAMARADLDALVDWICEAETLEDHDDRVGAALEVLRESPGKA